MCEFLKGDTAVQFSSAALPWVQHRNEITKQSESRSTANDNSHSKHQKRLGEQKGENCRRFTVAYIGIIPL